MKLHGNKTCTVYVKLTLRQTQDGVKYITNIDTATIILLLRQASSAGWSHSWKPRNSYNPETDKRTLQGKAAQPRIEMVVAFILAGRSRFRFVGTCQGSRENFLIKKSSSWWFVPIAEPLSARSIDVALHGWRLCGDNAAHFTPCIITGLEHHKGYSRFGQVNIINMC